MLSGFNRTVDKLPLAGKYALGPSMKAYIKASPEQERRSLLSTSSLLGLYIVGHAYQAKYGIDAVSTHMENLETTQNGREVLYMGLSVAYASVNAAVTIRQIELANRLNQIRIRKNKVHERSVSSGPGLKASDINAPKTPMKLTRQESRAYNTALAVTLAGQALFIGSFLHGEDMHQETQCVAKAENQLHQLEARGDSDETILWMHYEWADYCSVKPDDITMPHPNTSSLDIEY